MNGWWRRCGCGCKKWHRCTARPNTVDCRATVNLSGAAVIWVNDPAERCGTCLLVSDDLSTGRARRLIAAAQADVVAFLDHGVRLLQEQIDAQQVADMISEGGPIHSDAA